MYPDKNNNPDRPVLVRGGTDGIQRALGRAPRDFTDYAMATAATDTWSA